MLEAIGRLDLALFRWLRSYQTPYLDVVMAGFSDVTRGAALWIALALLVGFLYRTRWPAVSQALLAIALAFLVTDFVAKPLLNRSRPFESDAETRVYGYKPTTRSLPSGHTATGFAGAYALSRVAPQARAIFWTVALLVAFSRIYLGVHYPTDVLLGALLGLGVAMLAVGNTVWRFRAGEES